MSRAQLLYIEEEDQKKWNCRVSHNVVLTAVLIMMCVAAGAFYLAFHLWTEDGYDRRLIHREEAEYRFARNDFLAGKRIKDQHAQQQQMVDMLQTQVSEFRFNDSTLAASDVLQRYQQYNDTISQANATCVSRVNQLTAIVTQLISGTNSTPTTLYVGTCEFNGIVNETLTIDYEYRQLVIGGLDFYHYVFMGSNTSIVTGTVGARIENCAPSIFNGGTAEGTVFKSQWSQLLGQPAPASDYIIRVRVFDNGLTMEPVAGSDPLQTLQIEQEFSVFVSFF